MEQPLYQIQPPDATDYWIRMIKCQDACPVHTDACGYVTAIAEGRYQDAYRIVRATNPFASICGRVCGAPCEMNCRRGAVDSPVSIRALKGFVTHQFGPETGDFKFYHEFANQKMLPPEPASPGTYEKVAVIGAGVSGMTVAHDLARTGYRVTVFEAWSEAGGMLTAGVPVFRLDRDLVKKEIEAILSLGVEIKYNMRLGRDMTLQSLRRDGFKAVFLGIGLPKGRKLPLPGADAPNVYDGLEFLRSFNEGKPMPLGNKIVVIGGGNVAYDVARSAVRPIDALATREDVDAEMERGEHTAYDVARSILRMSDDKRVHVVCLEKRHEMPADKREIDEGEEEGIYLHDGWGPKEILTVNGKAYALLTVKCNSVFDAAGKFSPALDETQLQEIEADTIMFAIGQTSDLSFLAPGDGVESVRGLIKVNPETYQTTAPDVFACGDIAHGPRLFIHAVASAQVAARSMHDYLRNFRTDVQMRKQWHPAAYTMVEGWNHIPRHEPPVLETRTRATSIEQVELIFGEEQAREQAARCLRCNVNTVFDTSDCIACNGCVDVCPQGIIRLIGLSTLINDESWLNAAAADLDVPAEYLKSLPAAQLDELGGVMTKDEATCIRCAMCASRCPTHAITMQRFEFQRECVAIPVRNSKLIYREDTLTVTA
jgi:NADPH-dependent glutamate synthase beta subunit-like oxidoreductase